LVLETSRVLMRDENAIIRQKITRRNAALAVPLMTEIIRQGVREGAFTTPDPVQAAELIMDLSAVVGERTYRRLLLDGPAPGELDRLVAQMEFILDAIERILGARPGSLERVPASMVEQVVQAMDGRSRQG
jgi:hypothetical protein